MTAEIKRLHPHFFAEVSGVDLTQSFGPEILTEIQEAFAHHAVLLFRDQAFDDVSQIAFTSQIGPLERNIGGTLSSAKFGNEHPEMFQIMQREPQENLIKHRGFSYFLAKRDPQRETPKSASGRPGRGPADR